MKRSARQCNACAVIAGLPLGMAAFARSPSD